MYTDVCFIIKNDNNNNNTNNDNIIIMNNNNINISKIPRENNPQIYPHYLSIAYKRRGTTPAFTIGTIELFSQRIMNAFRQLHIGQSSKDGSKNHNVACVLLADWVHCNPLISTGDINNSLYIERRNFVYKVI